MVSKSLGQRVWSTSMMMDHTFMGRFEGRCARPSGGVWLPLYLFRLSKTSPGDESRVARLKIKILRSASLMKGLQAHNPSLVFKGRSRT